MRRSIATTGVKQLMALQNDAVPKRDGASFGRAQLKLLDQLRQALSTTTLADLVPDRLNRHAPAHEYTEA